MTAQSTLNYIPDEKEKNPASIEQVKSAQEPAATTSLAVIEIKKETALSVFTAENGLDPYLAELEARARAAIAGADITTIAGQSIIRSVSYSVSKSKKPLENMAADLKKDAYALVEKVNDERDRGIKVLDDLQKELRRPLTEYEEKEKARIDGHKTNLELIVGLSLFPDTDHPPTSEAVQARIDGLLYFKDIDWQEFAESAKAAKEKVSAQLSEMLVRIKKAEDDAIELARLRKAEEDRLQKERDDKIAADAAAEATRLAEQKAAEEKAEAERVAKAEQDRIQREKDEADEKLRQAETERKQAHTQALFQMAAVAKIPETYTAQILASRLDTMKAIYIREWQEFKPQADEVFNVGSKNLEILHGKAVEELATKRAAELAARVEAEKVSMQAQIEAEKAKADKAIQDERDRVAEEQRKQKEIDDKRAADKAHRAKINNEALAAIKALPAFATFPEASIQELIVAIAKGQIQNISIKY